MTDEYMDENKVLNPTINDTRSFVGQSDHSTISKTASSHESMVENRNSTCTSQNMLNQETAVEHSIGINTNPTGMARSREDTVNSFNRETALKDNLPSTSVMVKDQVGTLISHGNYKLMDENKTTMGDSNSAFNDTVDNIDIGDESTVKGHQPSMVNRRQSTFDSTGNSIDYVADCKEKKVEDNEGRSNGIVERNKATVEDTVTMSNFHTVDGLVDRNKDTVEETVGIPDGDSNLVDRDKATVEDTVATSTDHIVEGVVDRSKDTVEETVGIRTPDGDSNLVDRVKATVEDAVATSTDHIVEGVVDRNKDTVEDIADAQTHDGVSNLVDRNKATVEDIVTTSSDHIGEGVVDRNKATVEETAGTSLTGHVVDGDKSKDDDLIGFSANHFNHGNPEAPSRTDNRLPAPVVDIFNGSAGESTGHAVDGEIQSGVGMVDRNKETIEDSATSTQATDENNLGLANTTQHAFAQSNQQTDTNQAIVRDTKLEQRLQEQCNIVNNEHGGEKWTLQLLVGIASGPSIINYLPSSRRCFKWNKTVLFGRGEGVDVFINDDHASRDHVELIGQFLPNGQVSFMMRNKSKRVNSYNINGRDINDNKIWTQLTTGDQIRIASLVFNVSIIPARTWTHDFVLEIISPQIQCNRTSPPRPQSLMGEPQPYYYPSNVYPGIPHSSFVVPAPGPYMVPHSLPNARMPPPWLSPSSAVPFGPAFLTSERVEDAFRTYQDREGYVKFNKLRYLALKVVGEWKQLGRALGLEEWQIIRIDNDNPKIYEKSYQMLLTWVWKDPEQATVDNLRTGLEDITVGRGDLVLEYCTTAENHVDENDGGREREN